MDRYIFETNPQAEPEKELIESVDDLIADAKSRAGKFDRIRAFPNPPIEDI